MSLTDNDNVSVLSIGDRRKFLPNYITRLVLGARVVNPWKGCSDVFLIVDSYGSDKLTASDYLLAKNASDKIIKEFDLQRIVQPDQILKIRDRAQDIVDSTVDNRAGKYGILMLKDNGGCGYWRMSLPAKYMDLKGLYIDITSGSINFNNALEYDTIFVQRVHDWDSYQVLERLKKVGKRIVYDVDDDLFAIPDDNPVSRNFGRNEQMAAVKCMKLSDVITVSTDILAERLK